MLFIIYVCAIFIIYVCAYCFNYFQFIYCIFVNFWVIMVLAKFPCQAMVCVNHFPEVKKDTRPEIIYKR